MLEQVLMYLHNWFLLPNGVHEGTYTINDGSIALPFLSKWQYYRIVGSVFNDGLHKYGETNLADETFDGAIWALAIPPSVLEISAEMQEWETKNSATLSSPYQSESFGGYSYSKATGKDGGSITVFDAFESRLAQYKKPRELGYVMPTKRSTQYKRPFNPDYPFGI